MVTTKRCVRNLPCRKLIRRGNLDFLYEKIVGENYILELIFEKNKNVKDKANLVEVVRRIIRSSKGNRAKKSMVVDFINGTDLDEIHDKAIIIDVFFTYAQ